MPALAALFDVPRRLLRPVAIIVACVGSASAHAPSRPAPDTVVRPRYRVQASISSTAPQIEGSLEVVFTNHTRHLIREAVFILFPNRFSAPDQGINDFNRPFVYPELDFDPGGMEIVAASEAGRAVVPEPLLEPGIPSGCLVRIRIAPLAPDASRTLRLDFRTLVPHRFGSFGEFDRQLTLVGGWYPYLAALGEDGSWQVHASPPAADFDVVLSPVPNLDLVVNGRFFARGTPASARNSGVHYVSLVAAPELLREEAVAGDTRIVLLHRAPRRSFRLSYEPPAADLLLQALRDIVAERPPQVAGPPGDLVVVEAPLRLNLTAPGEGAVIVSDRALHLHPVLRPFHELQLAQAVYAELLRPRLAAREPPADYAWVGEGLSHELARRYQARVRPGTRSVYDWIELFNVFAIVDRFETVPKIPFVDAFFERARDADPLHTEIATFNRELPPGRVILGKLLERVGASEFEALVDRCAGAAVPFRRCVSARPGLADVLTQWLQPYPELNYRFESVALNRSQGSAAARGGEPQGDARSGEGLHHRVVVRRDATRPVTEPVMVRLRSIGGRDVDLRWDGRGDSAELSAETAARVWQAVIDPERKLIEDRLDDNAHPPTPQIVLDTAEVEISSTEFGISGLVVGRGRYDYRKDLAVAGFYTNRSLGLTAGGRWHWGAPIDATSYRHNVYGFYGFQSLDGGFREQGRGRVRTPGRLASLGVRYDYTNVFSFDRPSRQRQLRLFADWYDESLGSDFDYVDWGVIVTATQPLWSYRALAAAQLVNGFSETLKGSVVPNQGQYSLGGSRSIRGIGAEEELARNIVVVRAELRQEVYPEVDFNLFDVLVMRRGEVRLFADTGRVSNSAGRIYDVGGYAVGVGAGFAAVYEFLGFFPSVAYIELATRVDEASRIDDVQFLFGTRQAF